MIIVVRFLHEVLRVIHFQVNYLLVDLLCTFVVFFFYVENWHGVLVRFFLQFNTFDLAAGHLKILHLEEKTNYFTNADKIEINSPLSS